MLEELTAVTGFCVEKDLSQCKQTNLTTGYRKRGESRCRGSLAWLGRQTHNLENNGGQRPVSRSRGLESRPRHQRLMVKWGLFVSGLRQFQLSLRQELWP